MIRLGGVPVELVKDYIALVDKYAVLKKGVTIKELIEMAHVNDRLQEAIEQIEASTEGVVK